MARIRTIKPEFWRDEDLSSLCPEATLLAIGLLNHADDQGYFNANPKLIESDVFPLRQLSKTTDSLLNDLYLIGYIELYVGLDGKRYGHIVNFEKHQVISKKNPSKIKPMIDAPIEYTTIPIELPESSGNDTGEVQVGTGNREQGKEGKKKPNAPRFDPVSYLVDQGVNEQTAIDWVAVRKAKRAAPTKTAIDGIRNQANQAGMTLDQAIKTCCERGWASFQAEWVRESKTLRDALDKTRMQNLELVNKTMRNLKNAQSNANGTTLGQIEHSLRGSVESEMGSLGPVYGDE